LIHAKIAKILWQYNQIRKKSKKNIYRLYRKLLDVHPFINGNGRTMRTILISEWLKNGYSFFILTHSDKMKLIRYTINFHNNHKINDVINFLDSLEEKYQKFTF
jgi:fido (protein-threonine AMPylation protein)